MATSEEERIERLAAIFEARGAGVTVGIGDDAAVLAPVAEPLVWTVDAAVEGTHFRREWLSFEDIGYRATMAAASDLAAMGAAPLGVLSALVLPDDVGDAEMEALARGQREAAAALGTAVIGGNLARGRELSITTTALGRAARPVLRSGARAGDGLWLIGAVGLAAAGWRLLAAGGPIEDEASRACVRAWRRPRARIGSGLAMRAVASAAADVSDGLARDAGHIARASSVRAVIDAALLLRECTGGEGGEEGAGAAGVGAGARAGAAGVGVGAAGVGGEGGGGWTLAAVAARLGVEALDLALFGGEDYALVVAAPEGVAVPGAVRIGQFEALDDPDGGFVVAIEAGGARRALRSGGYDHFAPGAGRGER